MFALPFISTFLSWGKSIFAALLGSEIGRLILCAVVMFGIGWYKGYHTEYEKWEAAIVAQVSEAKQRDIDAANDAAKRANTISDVLKKKDDSNTATIKAYQEFLARNKDNCTLDDNDVLFLNKLGK